ncbi:MAG TPA: NAD(P)H-dependent oxidoreductase [Paraburkholderia sp.]|jgi:NAD(P)H dehydrogenase (quinone)|nr:NAD(P)H-dependent oxidoreductase [Paraburkholderia sp.]
MNVLYVYAHPEPTSLNGSLRDFAVDQLKQAGHTVQVSDLYAMQWKATLDVHDNLDRQEGTRFNPSLDSKRAFEAGTQSEDIEIEQAKLRWADTVIFQFPMWWFSMPAILKGWFERVYAYGFGYGVGEHSDARWGDRYGEGSLAGKRAMLIVTTGGWESHYSERGINGPIDDLLFPIHHGMLFYPGFDVLPPFLVYRTSRTDDARYSTLRESLAQRLHTIESTAPIPFRRQNAGDYAIPSLVLRPEIASGRAGFAAHVMTAPEQRAERERASPVPVSG